jgi:hypothetical protein
MNSDVARATAVESPKNTPKNPASSSGEGYLAVAARENGRYSEKNRSENIIAPTAIQRRRGEDRTERRPCINCSPAPWCPRRRDARRPSLAASRDPTATTAPRMAAQTRRRFSAPRAAARGLVSNPPITKPRTPPAPISGKKRFA